MYRIHEYIKRKEKLEKVVDNVNKDRVKSLLRTIYWRKKFKLIKEKRLKAERISETAAGSIDGKLMNVKFFYKIISLKIKHKLINLCFLFFNLVPRIMVNDSDAQSLRSLRIDTNLSQSSQTRNIRGTPSPVSSVGTSISTQTQTQTPASPGSPGSPVSSPHSFNSDP